MALCGHLYHPWNIAMRSGHERFLAIGHVLSEAGGGSMRNVKHPAPEGHPVTTHMCDGIVITCNGANDTFDVCRDNKKVNLQAIAKAIGNLDDSNVRVVDQAVTVFA
ncbi:hypothetical protein [Komagataeibacter sp. FXV3]|uniref:hypothetical protein n=1 Tax=Komagataeibacter sp. FXV3 TaxID=2608998 RepID=UPI00187BAE64|nr:hypothetical protein [Komagataeibacter sp. FXV3]MBE7730630.1 hypothetical protein [Komagataeibacter sp. FXV3]